MKKVLIFTIITLIFITSSCSKKKDVSDMTISETTQSSSTLTSSSSSFSTSVTTTTTKSTTILKKTTAAKTTNDIKPLIFDDPLLEKLIRKLANKSSGSIYASDLNFMCSTDIFIKYQDFNNLSRIGSESEKSYFHAETEGMVKSYKAFTTVPLKDISFLYHSPIGKPEIIYNLDLKWFTDTGALEKLRIPGNHEQEYEKQKIKCINIKNFNNISKCKNLKYLSLQDCTGLDLSALSKLSNLKSLALTNCSPIDQKVIDKLINNGVQVTVN